MCYRFCPHALSYHLFPLCLTQEDNGMPSQLTFNLACIFVCLCVGKGGGGSACFAQTHSSFRFHKWFDQFDFLDSSLDLLKEAKCHYKFGIQPGNKDNMKQ